MKTYFTEPITNLDAAQGFYHKLHSDGLLFHPEDSAETIIGGNDQPLFNAAEATMLNARVAETYGFIPDPCAFCLGLNIRVGSRVRLVSPTPEEEEREVTFKVLELRGTNALVAACDLGFTITPTFVYPLSDLLEV